MFRRVRFCISITQCAGVSLDTLASILSGA
jgi:hypothetical protein